MPPGDHSWSSDVLAFPMHGQRKLLREGYRTRDGHLIEWTGRLTGQGVTVISRPDPLLAFPMRPRASAALGTSAVTTRAPILPDYRSRRRWWVDSARWYPPLPKSITATPAVVWNPFVALAAGSSNPFTGDRTVVLDLLDDWSDHHAFAPVSDEVCRAYEAAFASATHVTANGEGTTALARRYGRDDVVLIPNGCDPERFTSSPTITRGPTCVGYVGKIGRRLDLGGIISTVSTLPHVQFVFAGPVLDREYRAPLQRLANLRLLGDLHYDHVPELLRTFDVGWVPHLVGPGEVGGDVIKTYEYRAAGLPVLTTPIAGAGTRGLDAVTARPMSEHRTVLRRWSAAGPRVPRIPPHLPVDVTWEYKTRSILRLLGVPCVS